MRKTILALGFILLFYNCTFAQRFDTRMYLCDSCENNQRVFLHLESTSFLKNNEYFNDFSKGFTGIGFFFKPSIDYYVTPKTKISGGIFLLKYSGMNNFEQAIPLFSIQHQLNQHLDLVFGSIYGSLDHHLLEPLYRFDNYYQKNTEYGLQLLYHSDKIESDLWLNWEKFIFKDSPFQEELVVGNSSTIKAYQSAKFQLSLPFQLLVKHKGGQIDASPDPMSSIINGATGLNLGYTLNKTNHLNFEPLFLLYQGWNLPESGINAQPFKQGKAFYLKLEYTNKHLKSMLGYWASDKFIAPLGEYLFQSVSEWDESFTQEKRKLLTAKINFTPSLSKHFNLTIKADAYYDLMNNNLSYSYGLYIIIKESFFMGKARPM